MISTVFFHFLLKSTKTSKQLNIKHTFNSACFNHITSRGKSYILSRLNYGNYFQIIEEDIILLFYICYTHFIQYKNILKYSFHIYFLIKHNSKIPILLCYKSLNNVNNVYYICKVKFFTNY